MCVLRDCRKVMKIEASENRRTQFTIEILGKKYLSAAF